MKTKLPLLFAIVLAIGLAGISCEGPEGPQGEKGLQGEQGVAGPQGPQGIEGNANVTRYTFAGHDFSVSSTVDLDIPGVTEEEIKQSSWHVYMIRSSGNVYPIPGWAVDGKTEYRVYMLHVPANNGSARIAVTIKNGTGEIYSEIIVIRVLANNTEELSKGLQLPDIDFSDYEAVKAYYGIPD